MAQHPRLGQDSPAHVLTTKDYYQYIAQYVVAESPNHTIVQIHDMADQEQGINTEESRKRRHEEDGSANGRRKCAGVEQKPQNDGFWNCCIQ